MRQFAKGLLIGSALAAVFVASIDAAEAGGKQNGNSQSWALSGPGWAASQDRSRSGNSTAVSASLPWGWGAPGWGAPGWGWGGGSSAWAGNGGAGAWSGSPGWGGPTGTVFVAPVNLAPVYVGPMWNTVPAQRPVIIIQQVQPQPQQFIFIQ